MIRLVARLSGAKKHLLGQFFFFFNYAVTHNHTQSWVAIEIEQINIIIDLKWEFEERKDCHYIRILVIILDFRNKNNCVEKNLSSIRLIDFNSTTLGK